MTKRVTRSTITPVRYWTDEEGNKRVTPYPLLSLAQLKAMAPAMSGTTDKIETRALLYVMSADDFYAKAEPSNLADYDAQ